MYRRGNVPAPGLGPGPLGKPRRQANVKVTISPSGPPEVPPHNPRQAWWRDLMWWPGSGLVSGSPCGDDVDCANCMPASELDAEPMQEPPEFFTAHPSAPPQPPKREQRMAKKSPLKGRAVSRRKDGNGAPFSDWTDQLRGVGTPNESRTPEAKADDQQAKKGTSTFQRLKALPRKLTQELVKTQPKQQEKVATATPDSAAAAAALAVHWREIMQNDAAAHGPASLPVSGVADGHEQVGTLVDPPPLPLPMELLDDVEGLDETLPEEDAVYRAPTEEDTRSDPVMPFLRSRQASRRGSASSAVSSSIGSFLADRGDCQEHVGSQRRRPRPLSHVTGEDAVGDELSSASQSPTTTRSARSHPSPFGSEMSSEDEVFGPSCRHGGRKVSGKAAKYAVDSAVEPENFGGDGSTSLGTQRPGRAVPLSKCSSRLTSNRSSIHEALPEEISAAPTRLASNRSSIHEVLLDDISEMITVPETDIENGLGQRGGMLSGDALAALFNADGELIPARWTPSIVAGSSGLNSAIHTGCQSVNSEMLSKESSRRSSVYVYSRRSSNHSQSGEREVHSDGLPLSEVQEEPYVERPILEEEENGQPSEEEEDTCLGSGTDTRGSCTSSVPEMHRRPFSPSERWEEWRTDFPLEILDKLADFFEEVPEDAEGHRIISLDALDQLLSSKLGFPAKVVSTEAETKGLVSAGLTDESLTFKSLSHFLDLIRGAVKRVEDDSAMCLWSKEDLLHIRTVFGRYMNHNNGRMPVVRLFSAVQDLNFAGLEVSSAEDQAWLAGVARMVVAKEVEAKRRTRHTTSEQGTLSQQELIHILSEALLERERYERRNQFQREREARLDAGLTYMETEDLRELHGAYLNVDVLGNNNPLSRLVKLFTLCGVRALTIDEQSSLKEITSPLVTNAEGEGAKQVWDPRLPVPFDVFVRWMSEVFERQIGGMQLPNRPSGSVAPEKDKKGFAAAMTRELVRGLSAQAAAEFQLSHGKSGRHRSSDCSVASSRRSRHSPRSRIGSRRGSKNVSAHSRLQSRSNSRGNSQVQTRSNSRPLSRSNSRSNSRPLSRCNSVGAKADGSAQGTECKDAPDRPDGVGKGVLTLKGLPPSEAMLARKRFRAISMDLTTEQQNDQPVPVPQDSMDLQSQLQQALSKTKEPVSEIAPSAPALSRLRSIEQEVGMVRAPAAPAAPQGAPMRQEKEAQDSFAVVTDAIAKLSIMAQTGQEDSNELL